MQKWYSLQHPFTFTGKKVHELHEMLCGTWQPSASAARGSKHGFASPWVLWLSKPLDAVWFGRLPNFDLHMSVASAIQRRHLYELILICLRPAQWYQHWSRQRPGNHKCNLQNGILVGGIPTPLENMSPSVGMIIPYTENKIHVPNHQRVYVLCSHPLSNAWNKSLWPMLFQYHSRVIVLSGQGMLGVHQLRWTTSLKVRSCLFTSAA